MAFTSAKAALPAPGIDANAERLVLRVSRK
jgi:hypothetical protein